MIMTRTSRQDRAERGERSFAGLLNRMHSRLLPYLGPPPLGPYDEEPPPTRPAACPLCGAPMSEHEIDRSFERTQLHCPTTA